ncbi:MAG: cell division protein FtsW [Kiritimatiellae bacterium]|nr:cell division protein FtsW [Kiritimatiellia bacterium]
MALGLIVLSSASEANGTRIFGNPHYFLVRQAVYLAIGVAVAAAVAFVDYHCWRDVPALAWGLYAAVFVLMLLVLPQFGGVEVKGSCRWLNLGPVRLQPSELAKLAIVVVTAVWMDRCGWRVELFAKGTLVPAALIGAYAFLAQREPDYGSLMVISLAGALVMFVAGARLWHMIPVGLLGGAAAVVAMCFNANRMRRILAFVHAVFDKAPAGDVAQKVTTATMDPAQYQAHMALVAIKNGGLWGEGLGNSLQKYYYLPECHTDFIFAIGAEELGLLFSLVVIALYAAFFALSVYIARHATDRFGRFLVIGMAFIIFFQAMFNVGVVCEALPTKGMALPFFSYGGTNLLCAFVAVGVILSVGIHSYRDGKRVLKRFVLSR